MSFFAIVPTLENLYYKNITNGLTLNEKDYIIGCNQLGPITITLPVSCSSCNGKIYIIKDESALANTNSYAITIQVPSGTSLDGIDNGSISIEADYGTIAIYNSSNTGWFTLYNYAP